MTDRRDLKGYAELVALAELKEMVAMEEVARRTVALRRLDAQIADLRDRGFTFDTAAAGAQVDKWLQWRALKLQSLYAESAKLKADLVKAAAVFGRAKAEHEVAKDVRETARAREEKLYMRRRAYIS